MKRLDDDKQQARNILHAAWEQPEAWIVVTIADPGVRLGDDNAVAGKYLLRRIDETFAEAILTEHNAMTRFHIDGNRLQFDYSEIYDGGAVNHSIAVNLKDTPPLLEVISGTGIPEAQIFFRIREVIGKWINSCHSIHIVRDANGFTLTNDIADAPVRVEFRTATEADATIQEVARKVALLQESTKVVTVPSVKDFLVELAAAEETRRTPTVWHGAEAVQLLEERGVRILGNATLLSVSVWNEEESMGLEVEMHNTTLSVLRSRALREAHLHGRSLPPGFVLTDVSEKEDERLVTLYDPGAKGTWIYSFRSKGTWTAGTRSDEEQALYIALMRAIKEW